MLYPKINVSAAPSVKRYEKYGWIILFVFWALHLVLSARDFFPSLQDLCLGCAPGAQTPLQVVTGMTWNQLVSSDPKFASFLASTLADDGISGVGLAVLGMVVSLTGYRKGEKWAWYVSWCCFRAAREYRFPPRRTKNDNSHRIYLRFVPPIA